MELNHIGISRNLRYLLFDYGILRQFKNRASVESELFRYFKLMKGYKNDAKINALKC